MKLSRLLLASLACIALLGACRKPAEPPKPTSLAPPSIPTVSQDAGGMR